MFSPREGQQLFSLVSLAALVLRCSLMLVLLTGSGSASVSSPVIAAVAVTSDIVELECRCGGWYPEPELLWLDAEGNLLPAGPTETVRGSDDLYTVSSRVTVDKRHSSNITCRVQQTTTNQSRQTHIHVTVYDGITSPEFWQICLTVDMVVDFCGVVLAGCIVWYIYKTSVAHLGEKKAQLQKLSKQTVEELDGWETVFRLLTKLKLGPENQRKESTEELKRTKVEIEEMKQRLQLVEKEIAESEKEKTTDRTEGHLKEKQNLLKALWKLEERKEKLEKEILNVEKLLLETENTIRTVRERKTSMENHLEVIRLQLDADSQSECVHLHRE